MKIGYMRVRSYGQSLETQWQKLKQEGCAEIFEEAYEDNPLQKIPELENALSAIREGDVLVVTRLDRLACSMQGLLDITGRLQEKGAQLKALDQCIDTTMPQGHLVFSVIEPFAEFERDARKARQMDGIRKARDRQVTFGRKPVLSKGQQQEIIRLSSEGNFSPNQLAHKYSVSRMTVYRIIKKSPGTAPEPGACDEGVANQPQAAGDDKRPRIYSSCG